MSKAITFETTGGPEVLRWVDVEVGDPGDGQVRLRHTAVGVNYIDTYHRSGLYPLELPSGIGLEAAGIVDAVGTGVEELEVGDRVAYASPPPGAYALERLMPADRLVKLPRSVDDRTAAAAMLKGMTAQYLLRRVFHVGAEDTILFHAAAGGVGLIACQWAKRLGATVIGTVGSDEKAQLARAHGCDHTIVYTREDFAARVREITDGAGVPVVYDSVGADTWEGSLDCLSRFGTMVSFGNSSGPVPPFAPATLSTKGSLFLTRPTLFHYTAERDDLVDSANELFEVLADGSVEVEVNQTYPLEDAAQAHRDLESRASTGSTVLLP
jgi:NADPH2:quinone reductase